MKLCGGKQPVDGNICDTWITEEWLEKVITDVLKAPAETMISKIEADRIGVGEGFMSKLIRVKIEWNGGQHEGLPDSVIIKLPTMAAFKDATFSQNCLKNFLLKIALRSSKSFLLQMHKAECTFYSLWPFGQSPPVKCPRCFYAEEATNHHSGVIVMEDVSPSSIAGELSHSLSLAQALQVAEALAGLHAWSLMHASDWVTKFEMPKRKHRIGFVLSDACKKLKKNWPEYFDPLIQPILDRYCTVDDLYYVLTAHEKFAMPPVLCHGDDKASNMTFNKEKDQQGNDCAGNELVALLDWQMCHPGCPAEDLARFICSSLSPEFRRNYTDKILTHYYVNLKKQLGFQEPPFTYETLVNAYWYMFKCAMFMALISVGISAKDNTKSKNGKVEDKTEMLLRLKCLVEDFLAMDENLKTN